MLLSGDRRNRVGVGATSGHAFLAFEVLEKSVREGSGKGVPRGWKALCGCVTF